MRIQDARTLAEQFSIWLQPVCTRLEIVGSVKRMDKEAVHDIEILLIADPTPPKVFFGQKKVYRTLLDEHLATSTPPKRLMQPKNKADGDKLKRFAVAEFSSYAADFCLELFIVQPETWAIQNVIRTGPGDFSKQFVTNKNKGGLLPNRYLYIKGQTQIFDRETNHTLELKEEKDALALLGLGWIAPNRRHKFVRGQ